MSENANKENKGTGGAVAYGAAELGSTTKNAVETAANENGFCLVSETDVNEISAHAYVMSHQKTKARLLFLQCEDENKAFSIAFKTPPKDNTGVFHILEHSVLCGSKKYPVKEPFVNLLKTSMQTFLNAMTFSDKTMYPVASTNNQDLLNLTDVYLDAVFHPAIYEKETIFQQEGWHYELAGEDAEAAAFGNGPSDDACSDGTSYAADSADAPDAEVVPDAEAAADSEAAPDAKAAAPALSFNGVVYNEMKGALSEPEDMLCNVINAGLFPSSPYGFESGGLPSNIPDLTYSDFLDEHRRHYRPDNSYIVLYGDVDLPPLLALIDQHLCNAQGEEAGASAAATGDTASANASAETFAARSITLQEPVVSLGNTYSMNISQENACCGIGYVMGDACDFTRINAMGVLIDALAGSNEAPLKRALLDEGIADDIDFTVRDSMAQPYVLAYAKGIEKGALETFHNLVTKHIAKIVEEGIDPELIEAALSHDEFLLRERDFGYADGVINAISVMAGWLYDDECVVEGLRYEKCFAYLREQMKSGYFEQLAREVFLENNHVASGEILAANTPNTAESERLEKAERELGKEGLTKVSAAVEALRAAQEQPDDPTAVAALPQLSPKDITDAKPWGAYGLDEQAPLPCLRHHLDTHGISYMQFYYNIDVIPFEELPYASLLAYILSKLATKRWSAAQLDTLIQSKTGALSFAPKVVGSDANLHEFSAFLGIGASCLDFKTADTLEIIGEIVENTTFSDTGRIKDLLTQLRIQLEQSLIGAGHLMSMERVGSYVRESACVSQQMTGIEFYLFLKDLLAHFDERAPELCAKLEALSAVIFNANNVLASFTGPQEAYVTFLETLGALKTKCGAGQRGKNVLQVPTPTPKNEAFIVPADITYTSCGTDRRTLEGAALYHGSQLMVANACSLDFIWNEVRVKGGAYGGGLRIPAKNDIMFYSYRDPRIDETLQRYRATATWLRHFEPTKREFDGYVVSSIASLDNPQKPRMMAVAQNNAYLCGRADDFRLQCRAEVLESTPDMLRAFADTLEAAADAPSYCTIGNRAIIENAKTNFNVVELF